MRRPNLLPPLTGPDHLFERARNAAYHLRVTCSELRRDALEREVRRLEIEHNLGWPFPARPGAVLTAEQLAAALAEAAGGEER